MRLIISLDNENLANRLSTYLQSQGIENVLEKNFDKEKQNETFDIWALNEDLLNKAKDLLNGFLKDPENIKYNKIDDTKEEKKPYELPKTTTVRRPFFYKITFLFLIACILIYLLSLFQWAKIQKKYGFKQQVMFTPIQMLFLYDLPESRILLDDVIIKYDLKTEKEILNPPPAAKADIEKIDNMPTWIGLYDIFLNKIKLNEFGDTKHTYILFEKIRQGQVWRLFTPILLHGGFLHILFNMLWFWYLSKQMEPKLKTFRYLLFIVITAVVSNTFQYIMAGPFFLGFSGVITAMVGFIFVRQKIAPWEGYTVPDAIFYFIGIFILAMLALQAISFFFQAFHTKPTFAIGIANTAHITGALSGMVLAKIPYFRRSHE